MMLFIGKTTSPNVVFGLFLWTKVTGRLTFAWRFLRFASQLGEEVVALLQVGGERAAVDLLDVRAREVMGEAIHPHPQAAGIVDRRRRALQVPGDEQGQRDRGERHEEEAEQHAGDLDRQALL